ncbi:MAG: lysylphosphatidylglycerol synthase transmembrane domain-containing protein [Thermoguttaceae bacterium]
MSDDPATRRRSWPQWCRLFGPILLGVMLWRVGPGKCWSALHDANLLLFLAACMLSIPALAVKGFRWQEILRAVGFEFSYGESMGVYAAGSLAGAVTPGKVGDLAKAPLLAARGVPWTAGVAASLLDRVFDAILVFVVGLASMLALPALPGRGIIAIAAVVAIGLTVAAALVFQRLFAKVLRTTSIRWWLIMGLTTVAALAPYFGSAYFCSQALGLSLGLVDVTAGASVAAVLALLPVTVSGIGTRDAAFVVIFASRGVDAEHAMALSGLILAWMLVNCVFFLVVARLCRHDAEPPPISLPCMGVTSHEPAE